jgi:hypothetical protein
MKRKLTIFTRIEALIAAVIIIVATQGCKETGAAGPEKIQPVELDLTPGYLSKIEHSTVEAKGKNDTAARHYEGVPLWRILDHAGISSGKMKPKEIVKRYLVAQGKDGFKVVFSLAELDTAFTKKEVLLADKLNGQALAADRGPYQLIVRDELRPTRNCYQIVKLTVYEAGAENKQD